jgi:hypothetical protein
MNKENINNLVDESVNGILKSLGTIFDNIKFNSESQLLEETNNLELSTSLELINDRLIDLLKVVNNMKVDYLKKSEYQLRRNDEVEKTQKIKLNMTFEKINQMQENFNYSSQIIKDWKMRPYYKYSLNFN